LGVAEHSAGRKLGNRGLVALTASIAVAGLAPVSTTASTRAAGARNAAGVAAATPIHPAHGKAFVPALGDWEGTVGGFPASFRLLSVPRFQTKFSRLPYGYSDMVMLRPASCPPRPGHYNENVIAGIQPASVGAHGDFGLRHLGIGGGLRGRRRAVLNASGCSGRLVWHLHPAHRAPVRDGRWKTHFSNGASGHFKVRSGGRLATDIAIPASLGKCGGPVGAVDLFIGDRGNAAVHQAKLTLRMHFKRARATGKLTVLVHKCEHKTVGITAFR
jgi:hypothetical protein